MQTPPPLQASFEDLGTPLAETTFCVIDLETTGGSPTDCGITEVGAMKVLRGEVIGSLHTLVDPGCPVPAFIRMLTGIGEEDLYDAPGIATVLPSLIEFVRDTVVVAHNARFDVSFLNAALHAHGYEPLSNQIVDTAVLARKVLAGEVPNHRLATLASYLRCAHQPRHRAFADVLATVDVLHHLIERVAGFGVTTLEDLISLSASRLDGTFSKISLTNSLPRSCGVYRFLGPTGTTLYVGKATDVRTRVRSYFYGDPRRKIKDLLRETQTIEVERHANTLEAEVAEARAIQKEKPPYNRAGKTSATWYLRATTSGRTGKLAAARVPKEDGSVYLGPFRSVKLVRTLIDALRDAHPIHRCSEPARCNGCAFQEMGRCAGSGNAHRQEMSELTAAISNDPISLFDSLERRMHLLAAQQRFEEATEVRERAALLSRTLTQNARVAALVAGGELLIAVGDRRLLIRGGRLIAAASDGDLSIERMVGTTPPEPPQSFLTAEQTAEARVIAAWIERHADAVRLLAVSGEWSMPSGCRPCDRFVAARSGLGGDRHKAIERGARAS